MKAPQASTPKQATKTSNTAATDIYGRIEPFLARRSNIIFYINLGLCLLFSFLLFDGRMSFATDDSTYIYNALAFLKNGSYPTFQGALYPLFLALAIKLFGLRILLLKTFSILFLLLHNIFMFKALKDRIPYFILFSLLFVSSLNAYILSYASSTFTESFYLMVQAFSIWSFCNLNWKLAQPGADFKNTLPQWLVLGFAFLLLSIAKNVALFAIVAVALYFLLKRKWKYVLFTIAVFVIFKLPYDALIHVAFPKPAKVASAQSPKDLTLSEKLMQNDQVEILMRKDPNDPSKGHETLSELPDRIPDNFGNYITVHTFKILGLRGTGIPSIYTEDKINELRDQNIHMDGSPFYGLIFLILFGIALYYSYKQNGYIFYLLLYAAILSGVTFVSLQVIWNQDRLILIFAPIFFMSFVYALYSLSGRKNLAFLKPAVPILAVLVLLIQLGTTFKQASKNSSQFRAYRRGDEYGGYDIGTANYLRCCSWAGENLQDTGMIVCMRNVEATVYGKKIRFLRLYNPIPQSPDSMLSLFNKRHIGYILIDGMNPDRPMMGSVAQMIAQKYPQKLEQLHTEGEGDLGSYLIKVKQ